MNSKKEYIHSPGKVADILTELLLSLPVDQHQTIAQINREAGVDLYKYHKGGSVPGIKAVVAGFTSMKRCPGWALLLACQVSDGTMTLQQARRVLKNWDKCQGYADGKMEEMISRMVEMAEQW